MEGRRLKRPSSARRNIKQESFSPFVSSSRLRRLQGLLSTEGSPGKSPDALLCILGIDSWYNDGMKEMADFLLANFFDSRKIEIARSGYEDEEIEDMMFVLRSDRVEVFCNPINYHFLLPYIAHWKNLRIHCLEEKDYDDQDKAEEFKIHSLVAMLHGCERIGIPFNRTDSGQIKPFDKMVIEKWPIIQGFAVEGLGGGGFFTLKYEVFEMSSFLGDIYEAIDPLVLEALITEQLPLFERQWNSMLVMMDNLKSLTEKGFSEKSLAEPLVTYFTHGRTGRGDQQCPGPKPFVLIGDHTCRSSIDSAMKGNITNLKDQCLISDATQPLHMICQAMSPRSSLLACRTYFLKNAFVPQTLGSTNAAEATDNSDIRLLMQIYIACISAVSTAMEVYSTTLDVTKAETEAIESLVQKCTEQQVDIRSTWLQNKKNVAVRIESVSKSRQKLGLGDSIPMMKSASIIVYDVPSIQSAGKHLGSVAFSEAFLESTVILVSGDEEKLNGQHLVLTENSASFLSWPLAASEKRLNRLMGEQLESDNDHPLGQLLVKGDGVHMSSADLNIKCMNGQNTPPSLRFVPSGQASFFEDGVIFRADHIGYISIPKASLVSINFYDGNSSNIVALLIVEYQETFTEHLPYFLHNHQHHLVFAFQPKTKIYKALFSDILPAWKNASEGPVMNAIENLPTNFASLHSSLQQQFDLVSASLHSTSPLKKAQEQMLKLNAFMQHLAVSSVGRSSIPEDSFSVVLDGTVNENVVDGAKQELIVTVLAGVPGCHKEKLCKLLTGLSKEENRWVIIHPMPDFPETFNAPRIQASLKAAWQAHYSRRKSARTPRALLIIPGYTDPVEAVQVVLNHPDPELAPKLKIGAVTVCIDPNNAFMSGHYTLPKLLDMCHEGWVNNILLTHDSKQNSETEVLQHLMRCTNPNVAFVVAPRAHLSRSPDIDLVLSESAFNHPDLMRARFLSNPGWWNGSSKADSCFPQIKSCILRFTRPLDKMRLASHLKDFRSRQSAVPFNGNVYHVCGRVLLDSVHDFKYTVLSDHLSLQPVEQNSAEAGYYVTFYGCQLSEDTLKNWLRQCAPKIPEKKVHRVRTSLTKAEVKRVHEAHHLDALPEGWFYNGSMFLSLLGEKSHVHPDLERHLEAYLEDVNAQVDAFNAKIDKTPAKDIFDP